MVKEAANLIREAGDLMAGAQRCLTYPHDIS